MPRKRPRSRRHAQAGRPRRKRTRLVLGVQSLESRQPLAIVPGITEYATTAVL
jgi:hypothetical protein